MNYTLSGIPKLLGNFPPNPIPKKNTKKKEQTRKKKKEREYKCKE